jgi:aldose 1-epimerase
MTPGLSMLQPELMTEVVTLAHGADRCDVIPQLGGSIGAWSVRGQDMMRVASAASIAAHDPYGVASFPLVPYSNRIGDGTFEWDGIVVALAQNFPPEPHAIHGVGFERPWQVQKRTNDSVVLTLRHHPDAGWPWAFEAQQHITLADGVLTLNLSAINLQGHSAPLAFGHHPYFPRAGAKLTFHAKGVWLVGDDGLPSRWTSPTAPLDFSEGLFVEQADIDHCFTGWSGAARIAWPEKDWALEITASRELPHAVVCIRSDLDAFCFEPVAHINDALNRQERADMPIIPPGESFRASITFRAVRR